MKVPEYFSFLEAAAKREYDLASSARSVGIDPDEKVEVKLATDLADRVESLVGPPSCAPRIRELLKQYDREKTCFAIMKEIFEQRKAEYENVEKLAEQCVRTGITILTEAVTAAGTEGISRLKLCENSDGSKYFSIFMTGPIRSAGGTAAAYTVILTDYMQKLAGLNRYVATDSEAERYAEEIELYQAVFYARQYEMHAEEAKLIAKNCPVCVDGEPTEEMEVSLHKNLPRVETNRVRGGMCLVMTEGFGLKAMKLLKFCKKHGLSGWEWLENFVKISKKAPSSQSEGMKPRAAYLDDIVGGRPIFSYPSTPGGFRLRYGRCRNTGINAKAIHPATMYVLKEFPAVGTQFKVERPGKGATIMPCDSIEPPTVLLKNGDVVRVDSVQKARELNLEVKEILFIGDLLISIGDFTKSNHPFASAGFCEEWWNQILLSKGLEAPEKITAQTALDLCKRGAPLHPKYTHHYGCLSVEELVTLSDWVRKGSLSETETLAGDKTFCLVLEDSPEKRLLERLCVPHKHREGRVIIEDALPFFKTLERVDADSTAKTPLDLINEKAGFVVYDKAPVFIGARMGRPEKARPRMMTPPPSGLFPVGEAGGKTRSIVKAGGEGNILVELPELTCPKCKKGLLAYKCSDCGSPAEWFNTCPKCGKKTKTEACSACGEKTLPYKKMVIDFGAELKKSASRLGERVPEKTKGVIGTTNKKRFFEPLEKVILRAKHGVSVFKDGTVRFDATNAPLTHFRPAEIGVSLSTLQAAGYAVDFKGKPLVSEEQVVEMRPQDIVVPESCGDYLLKTSRFVDDLLEKFYGLPRYYNAQSRNDLVGKLVVGLAPHISVGVLGRIIGFTKANAIYAHPYFHCAMRRDCDGDESSLMLLLDVFLNFSRHFMPDKRGSSMDMPLVLRLRIDPTEIDDQAYAMECVSEYPLGFYESTLGKKVAAYPEIDTVQKRLGKPEQYENLLFTHDTTVFDEGPKESAYTRLGTMQEKVDEELALADLLYAVDKKDLATRLLNFHFMRDIYGNLRAFGQQSFRCVSCNEKYRRVPLAGKCHKCGGKLLLTVNKGGIEKYLKLSKGLVDKYALGDYLQQRLNLVEKDLAVIFQQKPEPIKQMGLADFV